MEQERKVENRFRRSTDRAQWRVGWKTSDFCILVTWVQEKSHFNCAKLRCPPPKVKTPSRSEPGLEVRAHYDGWRTSAPWVHVSAEAPVCKFKGLFKDFTRCCSPELYVRTRKENSREQGHSAVRSAKELELYQVLINLPFLGLGERGTSHNQAGITVDVLPHPHPPKNRTAYREQRPWDHIKVVQSFWSKEEKL